MLPPTIPIFPLPNVVLFPNVFLPLHIFEPRYRAMTADALQGDRIIGMTLLQPGYEAHYAGRPRVYPIGCAGVITHTEQLADGRYNIVLRGIEKFRIDSEDTSRAYRLADVTAAARGDQRGRPPAACHSNACGSKPCSPRRSNAAAPSRGFLRRFSDEDLVNALAQYLDLQPIERQALLERDGVLERGRALIELLEMRMLAPGGHQGGVH